MKGPLPCDPESVFELADGSLGPEREREIRAHLSVCGGCRTLYERELRLNASLGSLEFEETNSVAEASRWRCRPGLQRQGSSGPGWP